MIVKDMDRLSAIGKLIGIYREEKRNNSQNSYTQKTFCEGICTVNTLKRVEAGERIRSEDVYIELLMKFNLKFQCFPEVDKAILLLMDDLYNAIEYYKLDEIKRITQKAIRLLERVKEYVYYSDLFLLMDSTYEYYSDDREISIFTMYHFNFIVDVLDTKYSSLVKRMIYTRTQLLSVTDLDLYKSLIDGLDLTHNEYPSMRALAIHYFYITSQYLGMKDLIEEVEVDLIKENNYIRLIDVYNCAIFLFSKIERTRRVNYINKIENLINEHKIPDIKIGEVYSSIGLVLHHEDDFEGALSYFNKTVKHTSDIYLPYLLYMANCQCHLNKKVEIPVVDKTTLSKYSSSLQLMYNYFHYYDAPPFVKLNTIMKDIAPELIDEDLISIFRYELRRVAEEINSYKNLFIFDEMIENNLSKIS